MNNKYIVSNNSPNTDDYACLKTLAKKKNGCTKDYYAKGSMGGYQVRNVNYPTLIMLKFRANLAVKSSKLWMKR